MRAAVFQFDVTHDAATNLSRVEEGLHQAAAEGVDLVVLPEMWPTSFPLGGVSKQHLGQTTEAWQRVRELSSRHGLCVIGSGFGRSAALPSNRLRIVEGGEELSVYDKVHLFSPTAEGSSFSAGDAVPSVVKTDKVQLTAIICYDLRFAGLLDKPWREGFDLLAICAQWPVPRIAHWRALAIARAVERQCFVVACNRIGSAEIGRRRKPLVFPGASLIVSPLGEVLVEADDGAGLFSADLELDEARRYRTRIPLHKDERPEVYGA